MHRLIVTSATYRQSSNVTPELLSRDPVQPAARARAALPRRGRDRPRHRAGRERPAEPEGRRPERLSAGAGVPVPAAGQLRAEDLERRDRGRTATAARSTRSASARCRTRCCRPSTRRTATSPASAASRSNTPLQALTTLNEPLSSKSARALALRTLKEGGATDAERLTYAFRCCLSRTPEPKEQDVLLDHARQAEAAPARRLAERQRSDRHRAGPEIASCPRTSTPVRLAALDRRRPRAVEPRRNDHQGVAMNCQDHLYQRLHPKQITPPLVLRAVRRRPRRGRPRAPAGNGSAMPRRRRSACAEAAALSRRRRSASSSCSWPARRAIWSCSTTSRSWRSSTARCRRPSC